MKKRLMSVVACAAVAMIIPTAVSTEGLKFGYTCMDGTNPFFVTIEGRMRELPEIVNIVR